MFHNVVSDKCDGDVEFNIRDHHGNRIELEDLGEEDNNVVCAVADED